MSLRNAFENVATESGQGTDGTSPPSLPGGSTGVRGWLRGLYTKLSDASQKTQVVDGSGNVIGATSNALDVNIKSGAAGGTQYTDDAVGTTHPIGNAPILIRKDTPAASVSTDGDNIAQRGTNYGAAYVTLLDTSGSPLAVGGGTQYTEDAASAADPIGPMNIARRRDTLTVSEVSTDGDNIALNATNKGQLHVKLADTVIVDGNGGTFAVTQGTGTNLHTVIDSTTALTPGTGAANLGKAEDAASASGDTGVMIFGVRRDTPSSDVSNAGDYATFQTTQLGAQWVVTSAPFQVQVASGGLTTATTAYSANDQVGTIFTFASAALASAGGGYIESILLNDETAIIGSYRVWLFNASPTLASDNAAFSLSDADSEKQIGDCIDLGPVRSAVNNFQAGWYGSIPYTCNATSIFAALQTLGGHTFFSATTSLKLNITFSRMPV